MKLFFIGIIIGAIANMVMLPYIVRIFKNSKTQIEEPEGRIAEINDNGELILNLDALTGMIREDVTKQYIRQIWMNVAVALIPLMLTFTATAYCIITEYNNDINRQISEHNLQTQERICQLEKQIAILEQKLDTVAEQTPD